MSFLLNVLWFILGGFIVFLAYILGGILLCITIALRVVTPERDLCLQ